MSDAAADIPLVKKWLVAVRPFAYTASVTSVALGLALSYYGGYPVSWGLLGLTLLGVVCFHTAANLLNDCYDHRRGLDTEVLPTSGAVVRGWISEKQAFRAAMGLLAAGAACGAVLTILCGREVLFLGVIGTVIALGYTRGGVCFKYAGLGDLAIFLAFGALPVFGTYWVQARAFSWSPILWSVPLASLTVAILHANNWRDIQSDPGKNCTTMASMLGEERSATYYRLLVLGPFALAALFWLAGIVPAFELSAPWTVLLSLGAVPVALKLTKIRRDTDGETFMMLDGKTAQMQLLFGLLLPLTFVLARLLGSGQG